MSNFDSNPFAGDSENPFAVSIWQIILLSNVYNCQLLVNDETTQCTAKNGVLTNLFESMACVFVGSLRSFSDK